MTSSWNLKSPTIPLQQKHLDWCNLILIRCISVNVDLKVFVISAPSLKLVWLTSYNRENIKALHYWPFVRGIHQWPVDSLSNVEHVFMPWRHLDLDTVWAFCPWFFISPFMFSLHKQMHLYNVVASSKKINKSGYNFSTATSFNVNTITSSVLVPVSIWTPLHIQYWYQFQCEHHYIFSTGASFNMNTITYSVLIPVSMWTPLHLQYWCQFQYEHHFIFSTGTILI